MTNLSSVQPRASHDAFVHHVATSFGYAMKTGDLSLEGYVSTAGRGEEVVEVSETEVLGGLDERAGKVRSGMEEMKVRASWLSLACVS